MGQVQIAIPLPYNPKNPSFGPFPGITPIVHRSTLQGRRIFNNSISTSSIGSALDLFTPMSLTWGLFRSTCTMLPT